MTDDKNTLPQLLVSKQEASRQLGISVRTLEKLLATKAIPARRIGRRVLLHRSVVERFARGTRDA
jgi:excisionase family DNA binding protein